MTTVWQTIVAGLLPILAAETLQTPAPAQAVSPALTTLYAFTGGGDGGKPNGVVFGKNGALFGTTGAGGAFGSGTVFELTPAATTGGTWTGSVLYSFTNQKGDGSVPEAGVTLGRGGVIYGTTSMGGAFNFGTAFELTPPSTASGTWNESVLYSFPSTPSLRLDLPAKLTPGPNGVLYGTTNSGGTFDYGTVYELIPPLAPGGAWTEITLYNFTGQNGDGAAPEAPVVVGSDGSLYGTTKIAGSIGINGLGTVFELAPPATTGGAWTETVLYSFKGGTDGRTPVSPVVLGKDGAIYGTTFEGGGPVCLGYILGCGTVYQLAPPSTPGGAWSETVLHRFTGTDSDGAAPLAGLIIGANGTLFGTTYHGGARPCGGTVFGLTPPAVAGGVWTETVLHIFTCGSDGGRPAGSSLVFGKNGALYGVTSGGGTGHSGTVFELTL